MEDRLIQLLQEKGGIRLDVACGKAKQDGWIGIDKRDLPGVDIVHDIETFPWPLPDACAVIVIMSHIVEHIRPWVIFEIMDEVWRVTKEGGHVLIATPHYLSPGFAQDPTHVHGWSQVTPRYFCAGNPLYDIYTPKPWALEVCDWVEVGNLEIRMRKLPEEPTD